MKKTPTKSIGKKLKKVCSYESQQATLLEWSNNWHDDQANVIARLRCAAMCDDHSEIMHMIQQLEGLTEKRFGALNNVFKTLLDPDRVLKRSPSIENESSESQPIPTDNKQNENHNITETVNVDVQNTKKTCDPVEEKQTIEETTVQEKNENPVNETEELISEMIKCYNAGISLNEMSSLNNISAAKIIKILVTAGVYSSDTYDKVKYMRECGISDKDIAYRLSLGKSAMNSFTPYSKGVYGLKNPSQGALNLRKYRESKKAQK